MTVLVIGAAVSGRAAIRLLEAKAIPVTVYDADPIRAAAAAGGRHRVVGGPWDSTILDGVESVVVSPGVPEAHPAIVDALAAGLAVSSEVELAATFLDVPIAAITGTNGKTTVTEIAAEMLLASGVAAAAVGNIGDPLCDAVGSGHEALVIEVSSFQLRFIDRFHPDAAVLLNLAPDHLDWHGTFEAYRDAKRRIFENQGPGDLLVYDADDEGATAAIGGAAATIVAVSGRRRPIDGSGVEGSKLWIGDVAVDLAEMSRSDPVFLVDAVAAGVAAGHIGATAEGITQALVTYRSGAHRREIVAQRSGVVWINDSKATNPHAALASIDSYPSVVLIAGGRNKGLDVEPIARRPNVRYVIGIGEAGSQIVDAAASGEVAQDLEDAVDIAARVARSGDTVLLAPGCASFDMFDNYGHRGDEFRRLVREVA